MVFSSTTFLFLFLPLVLLLYFISPGIKLKNVILLIVSIIFYSWGEPDLVLLMLVMIILNYFVGRAIGSTETSYIKKRYLVLGIILNILSISYFKYAGFIVDNMNTILSFFNLPQWSINKIRLPIGISFFTFQSLSYLIDVYRGTVNAQKNILNLGLYISFFPQLIAGPIVRYHDIAEQIKHRFFTASLFNSGTKRFIVGLSKKVIIANTVGYYADQIFMLPAEHLSSATIVWGALLYSLQIYFDFSGYSDMAIGLGRIFGFKLLENFNFPYIATSVQDFWKRWHISLSTWFRDYLYIPLGGNRKGNFRTYINLCIVFLVTGLWHGANWNFILWGMLHGCALIIERLGFSRILLRLPKILRHIYVLSFIIFSWILFRVDNLQQFVEFSQQILALNAGTPYTINLFFNKEVLFAVILGVIFSMPIKLDKYFSLEESIFKESIITIAYLSILILSLILVSANTYNPFIYFQF